MASRIVPCGLEAVGRIGFVFHGRPGALRLLSRDRRCICMISAATCLYGISPMRRLPSS